MSSLISDEAFAAAMDAVAQMFSASKAVCTPLEGQLWGVEIERLGDDRLMAFAAFWLSGESGCNRAPKVQDFKKYCDPAFLDESLAFDELIKLVRLVGPYESPKTDARLDAVIHKLGGWVEVCQSLPDPSDDFKIKRWKERFSVAYQGALAAQIQGLPPAPEPIGLCAASAQGLLLAGHVSPLLEMGDVP